MNKNGQFFLIMSFIILGLIVGLAAITNSVNKKIDTRFDYTKDELDFESEKVIDYGASQGFNDANMKQLLTNFAQNYSAYSNADDFYYIFGTTSEITFAGCKKKSGGQAIIESSSGTPLSTLSIIQGSCNQMQSNTLSFPPANIVLKAGDTKFPFTLRAGQNFYFVVSKEMEGDIYVAANS